MVYPWIRSKVRTARCTHKMHLTYLLVFPTWSYRTDRQTYRHIYVCIHRGISPSGASRMRRETVFVCVWRCIISLLHTGSSFLSCNWSDRLKFSTYNSIAFLRIILINSLKTRIRWLISLVRRYFSYVFDLSLTRSVNKLQTLGISISNLVILVMLLYLHCALTFIQQSHAFKNFRWRKSSLFSKNCARFTNLHWLILLHVMLSSYSCCFCLLYRQIVPLTTCKIASLR